jgi:hypothetical protein
LEKYWIPGLEQEICKGRRDQLIKERRKEGREGGRKEVSMNRLSLGPSWDNLSKNKTYNFNEIKCIKYV